MELWSMETRLADACLMLGHICTEEARWADDPEVKAVMLRHALGFLDVARRFLPSCAAERWVGRGTAGAPVAGIVCRLTKDKKADTRDGS